MYSVHPWDTDTRPVSVWGPSHYINSRGPNNQRWPRQLPVATTALCRLWKQWSVASLVLIVTSRWGWTVNFYDIFLYFKFRYLIIDYLVSVSPQSITPSTPYCRLPGGPITSMFTFCIAVPEAHPYKYFPRYFAPPHREVFCVLWHLLLTVWSYVNTDISITEQCVFNMKKQSVECRRFIR